MYFKDCLFLRKNECFGLLSRTVSQRIMKPVTIKRKQASEDVDKRIKKLEKAKDEYYNTGKAIMTDAEYDAEETIVAREAPDAEVLKAVGSAPRDSTVKLPFTLPSLQKIKPGEKEYERWMAKQKGQLIWSAKLDGISALWHEGRLYNRGDGLEGTEITRFKGLIKGLVKSPWPVRGEIIVRRSEAPSDAKLIRSWVNGALHRKPTEPQVAAGLMRFVAYRIVGSELPMAEQFAAMKAAGFELPDNGIVEVGKETLQELTDWYQSRRAAGAYDIDGLVVTSATKKPESQLTAAKPTDIMAFKMALDEQQAETTVKEVEWNLSRNGVLVPRVIIEPVVIGGATISKVTGHNAKFICDEGIGPGAGVVIIRSGDVIPIIDSVTEPVEPVMPACDYVWDSVHIKAVDGVGDPAAKLLYAFKILELKGAGPAIAAKLVEAGLDTIFKVHAAKEPVVAGLIGSSSAAKLKAGLAEAIEKATMVQRIKTCPGLPAGLGTSRFQAFIDAGADFDGPMPDGLGPQTWALMQSAKPTIREWIARFPRPAVAAPVKVVETKGSICLTGFRDAAWQKELEAAGWAVKATVSKGLSYLIVPDASFTSTKVDAANKYNIPVVARDAFVV
jgi:DNA ligase (NAD+)